MAPGLVARWKGQVVMARYKVGFRNRSANERIEISRHFITSVVNVPASKRQLVRLDELAAALAAATTARAEYLASQSVVRLARERYVEAVKVLCERVTFNATGLSNGVADDDIEYLAAGLDLAAPKDAVGPPPELSELRVERLAGSGRVGLRWKCPLSRASYRIEVTTDPNREAGWKQHAITSRRSVVLNDLRSAVWQWVRVACVNAHGQGPWSTPVRVLPE
jgi:hypothetical protein